MAIQLTEGEVYAFNVLNNQINTTQQEFQRCIKARESYIVALEIKYDAKFDLKTGLLVKKDKAEEKARQE